MGHTQRRQHLGVGLAVAAGLGQLHTRDLALGAQPHIRLYRVGLFAQLRVFPQQALKHPRQVLLVRAGPEATAAGAGHATALARADVKPSLPDCASPSICIGLAKSSAGEGGASSAGFTSSGSGVGTGSGTFSSTWGSGSLGFSGGGGGGGGNGIMVGTFGASRRTPLMSLAHCQRNQAATAPSNRPAPHFSARNGGLFFTGNGGIGICAVMTQPWLGLPVTSPTWDSSSRRSKSSTSITFWYCTAASPRTITGKSGFSAFSMRRRSSSSPRVTG